jgi:hypothetical protein
VHSTTSFIFFVNNNNNFLCIVTKNKIKQVVREHNKIIFRDLM